MTPSRPDVREGEAAALPVEPPKQGHGLRVQEGFGDALQMQSARLSGATLWRMVRLTRLMRTVWIRLDNS